MVKYVLKNYLENLQKDESIFPMDSVHTGKKLVLKPGYPESKDEDKKKDDK